MKYLLPAVLVSLLLVSPKLISALEPSHEHELNNEKVETLKIEATEFSFSPNYIELQKGKLYAIIITNAGKEHHEFLSEIFDDIEVKVKMEGVIIEGNIEEIELAAGKSVTIQFKPNKTGTFKYVCKMKNHDSMSGEIKVL